MKASTLIHTIFTRNKDKSVYLRFEARSLAKRLWVLFAFIRVGFFHVSIV